MAAMHSKDHPSGLQYLPELDGLRGICLLVVLFGHAGLQGMPGFYVSVDVFFVISGYLMTKIILRSIASDDFSFAAFYLRRMKRLTPALIWTALLALVPAWFIFSPVELEKTTFSSLASALGLANLRFYFESGYLVSHEKDPLLHTWSLSMEEQFYFIWPPLLFYWRRHIRSMLAAVFLLSLIGSYYVLTVDSRAAFLIMPLRMYEFLLGAVVLLYFPRLPNRWAADACSISGITMIAFAVLNFDRASNFPGFLGLVPSGGAALLIAGLAQSRLRSLFILKPLVFLGRISYSTYLLHYPIMVSWAQLQDGTASAIEKLFLVSLSIILGLALYHVVEKRYRLGPEDKSFPVRPFLIRVGLGIGLLLSMWLVTKWQDGFPGRFDRAAFTPEQVAKERSRYWREFHKDDNRLLIGERDAGHAIIVGNSHGIDLIYMLRLNGARTSYDFVNYPLPCGLFAEAIPNCDPDSLFNKIAQSPIGFVLVAGSWPLDGAPRLEARIKQLISAGKQVIVFGPRMKYSQDLPRIHLRGDSPQRYEIKEYYSFNEQLRQRVEGLSATYVDLLTLQCPEARCETVVNGMPHYIDTNHLTRDGARHLGERLRRHYPSLFD